MELWIALSTKSGKVDFDDVKAMKPREGMLQF